MLRVPLNSVLRPFVDCHSSIVVLVAHVFIVILELIVLGVVGFDWLEVGIVSVVLH